MNYRTNERKTGSFPSTKPSFLPGVLKYVCMLLLFTFFSPVKSQAQTDFAPGEIMFIGYRSDNQDTFSIVLLNDVLANTVIFITDRGWSNTTGFRAGTAASEGTISLTFNANYPCGKEIFFGCNNVPSPDTWAAFDVAGVSVGTVAITAGTNGPSLDDANGDQLFIYQAPTPTAGNQASFITAIHMDGAWAGNATTDANSALPTGLTDFQVVVFNAEFDNAKYDCDPRTGSSTFLRLAISNEMLVGWLRTEANNNWAENNTPMIIKTSCPFCCHVDISGPDLVSTNSSFTIQLSSPPPSGEVWQLRTAGCTTGSPLQTTSGTSFTITAPGAEGNITYYVKASGTSGNCPDLCSTISICVENTPYATCNTCGANPETCGDCLMQDVDMNPDLDSGCYEMRLIFILDESGSINGFENDVENGVMAFLSAVNGQAIQAAFIEFSTFGTLICNYTLIDDAFIANMQNYFDGIPFNGQTYNPNGCTNWHDAMVDADALTPNADMLLLFTDGDPTCWSTNGNICSNGGSPPETPEIVNPVKIANKMKGEGTHMFMLGVGTGIDVYNLQLMSGMEPYQLGTNTIGTSDYSIGNFASLATTLASFIEELCRTTIDIQKEVVGPICSDTVVFRFIVTNLGDQSATAPVFVTDTFPTGYTNLQFYGPQSVKICPFNVPCNPPQPANAFVWATQPIPPLSSDTLLITATVLPTGNYTNVMWALSDNVNGLQVDTFDGDLLEEDLPPTISCPPNVTIQCSASTLPANTGTPTANDPDGGPPTLTYSDVTANGNCPITKIITRTWFANDGCNPLVSCVQMIYLTDTTPPVITCPANVTVLCGSDTSPGATGTATGVDACDPTVNISHSDVTIAGICPAEFTVQRTWVASDDCNNTSTCVQTIFVDDNQGPTLVCKPSNIDCAASIDPSNTGFPLISNNCGGTTASLTYTDQFVFSPTPPQCSIIRTWTATDNCGNSATCTSLITLQDSSGPAIFCPANVTVACSASTLPGSTGSATATDNCAIAPTIAYSDNVVTSPSCPQNKTITRTWTATDECGNTTSCNQTITVVDIIAPSISCPANVTILCTANTLPANTGSPTSNDNCDASPTITYTDVTAAGSCPQEYTITRTWKSQDDCGNFNTCNQIIFIDDNLAPAITCPANITILCTASTLPANTGSATGTDNCDATAAITFTDVTVAGSCPQEYTITRTWKAQDDCGNFNTCNQIIFVDDNLAPAITCPPNVTILCSASTAPSNTGNATATDNCDTTPAITSTDVITGGACPQAYTITRTWRAQDDCGNFLTCVQIITVIDNVAPTITCPANVTIQCNTSTLPAATGQPTSTDNCDGTPTITFTDVTAGGACPQEFTITRTWKSQDDCGNFNTCVQTIVVDDSTAPVLTCPPNITIQCSAVTLPVNTGTATAADNCDITPTVTYSDVTTAGPCPQKYNIARTWSAVDDCGNTSSCVQTIVVTDNIGPVITCPANVTIQCTASTDPANNGTATAIDNCDPTPTITYTDVTTAGLCPQEYTITRTWRAEDDCGNFNTCNQIIFIDDSTPPVITCPPNTTILCTSSTLPANTGSATATDNCDPSPDLDFIDITMTVPGSDGYHILRTWTAIDNCGNTSSCNQSILVNNPLNPEILGQPFDTICSGESVTFQAFDQGISPITYQWSFGSGSNPSSANGIGPHNVAYTYNTLNGSVGAWVVLTVTTPGCPPVTDTVSNIHVNAIPNAAITTDPADPCVFQAKTFQPTAPQMSGFTYTWNFGAGAIPATATTYGPHAVEYSTTGIKTVKLVVASNEAGASCMDSTSIMFNVNLCPGQVTGRVFLNTNTTDTIGIQSANVRLFTDNDLNGVADNATFVRNVFTNPEGRYSMASLTPGYYVIVETQPSGYFSLWDDDTSQDFDSLSNFNPNDNIIPVTVESNEVDTRNFFVEVVSPGIVSGYVFEDINNNQSPQPDEGIPGVTITAHTDNNADGVADGGAVASAITNGIGFYTFGGLALGNYVLVEIQPAGYDSELDIDPTNDGDVVPNTNMMNDTLPLTLSNTENDADNFFIESTPCSQFVTTTEDNVPGSLRFAIACAAEWDTIKFHPNLTNQVIHLNAGRIEIDKSLYIHSSLVPTVMIESENSGAFAILAGKTVEFKDLNFTSGLTGFPGAQFENYGHLILWNSQVFKNPLLPPGDYLIFNDTGALLTVKGTFQLHD